MSYEVRNEPVLAIPTCFSKRYAQLYGMFLFGDRQAYRLTQLAFTNRVGGSISGVQDSSASIIMGEIMRYFSEESYVTYNRKVGRLIAVTHV